MSIELHNSPSELIKCFIGLKILPEIFCLKHKFVCLVMYSTRSSVIIISKISIASVLWTAYDIPGVPINCCFFISPTRGSFCHSSSSYLPTFFFLLLVPCTTGGSGRTVFITNRFSILRYSFVTLKIFIRPTNNFLICFWQYSFIRTIVTFFWGRVFTQKKTNSNQNQINIVVLFQLNLLMQLPKKWSSFLTPSSVYGWY